MPLTNHLDYKSCGSVAVSGDLQGSQSCSGPRIVLDCTLLDALLLARSKCDYLFIRVACVPLIWLTMSATSVSLSPLKGSNIPRHMDKQLQGDKSPKKPNCDSEGLYKPINPERREIRLLHIKPSLEFEEKPQCFLQTVSLNDNPQFEALSYVWGDPNVTRPIRLDDREWYATINLEAGLRYLRSDSKDVVIWVDALCVDQSSIEERNSQILLMKTIYSNAERVKVWLGEPTSGSDDALAILEQLGRSIRFKDIRLKGKRLSEENARSLNDFISRPWWNRVWVQQEYSLAKDVALQCGLQSLEYSPILELKGRDLLGLLRGWERSLSHFIQIIGDSASTSIRYREDGGHPSKFTQVLAHGCFKDCTDLRDSIYGFLGLARQDFVDAMRPDYSIPLNDVFRRTAVKHMSYSGALSFFSFNTWKPKAERLVPTWVPDWPRLGPFDVSGDESEYTTQNLDRSVWRYRALRFGITRDFKACATRTLSSEIIDETTVMLNGHCLGQVTHVSPNATPLDSHGLAFGHNALQVIEGWLKFFDRFADRAAFPSAAEGRRNPIWRIFTGDHYCDPTGYWRTCEGADYESYQAFKRDIGHGGPLTPVAKEYFTSFLIAGTDRRLFATDRGYIGLGPREMQEGDHVYILSGGDVPYILRPIPGPRPRTFELVGDCYLHGIMYGEAAGTDEDYHDVYLE